MEKPFEVGAVIPAAGSGRRMNTSINKIMLPLLGQTVLERTLEIFLASEFIRVVVLVLKKEESPGSRG